MVRPFRMPPGDPMNALANALSGLPTARPEEVGLSRGALQRLSDAMEREVAAGRAPGVSMMVARHGKVGFLRTLGAQKPDGPEMSLDAIFRIYSMTKPIVTVAAMTLVEEGRLTLADPVAQYVPAFADVKVGVETSGRLDLVAPKRPMTVQDLMRHTSGLTYGFTGDSHAQRLTLASGSFNMNKTTAEMVDALARLPLQHQPGDCWEYGHSTDVLGRVVEVVADGRLSEVLSDRIFRPLNMEDTAFFTPPSKLSRRAEPYSINFLKAWNIDPMDVTAPPLYEMGGTGLVSTLGDYARFAAMLSGGGSVDGVRILGPRTVAYMASDHLGSAVPQRSVWLAPGHGFGLGFSVRTETGVALATGSVGEYSWGGVAGTVFWVSPRDNLFAVFMVQAPDYFVYLRTLFRNMVNAAII